MVAGAGVQGAVTIAGLIFVDLVLIALLDVVVVRPIARRIRCRLGNRRIGQLPAVASVLAEGAHHVAQRPPDVTAPHRLCRAGREEARRARLLQLGEAGTYKVYNCGKILDVDFEHGVLICERENQQ